MNRIKEKLAEWSKDKQLVRVAAGFASAILLLIVCLCISIYMRSNIQRQHEGAANLMQEQVYQGLSNMTALFARVDEPGVDVQNKLIPELRAEYKGVSALNAALAQGFGWNRAVLTQEQTAAFDEAFAEYSDAYRQGLATGLAQADMAACIQDAQQMIDARNAPKVEPTEPVVIIDGSSGAIADGNSR